MTNVTLLVNMIIIVKKLTLQGMVPLWFQSNWSNASCTKKIKKKRIKTSRKPFAAQTRVAHDIDLKTKANIVSCPTISVLIFGFL